MILFHSKPNKPAFLESGVAPAGTSPEWIGLEVLLLPTALRAPPVNVGERWQKRRNHAKVWWYDRLDSLDGAGLI